MDTSQLQQSYFAVLREKYQVGQHKSVASDNFLYLILRKANAGIQITDPEFQWLAENRLFGTIEIIASQQYQAKNKKRLESEFLELRSRYRIPPQLEFPMSSPVYVILWKLDNG